jgi:hypothetical protein
MRNVPGAARSTGPTAGRGTPRFPPGKMVKRVWISGSFRSLISRSTMLDTNTPNAMVDRARYKPRSRSDGSATRASTRAHTTAAST